MPKVYLLEKLTTTPGEERHRGRDAGYPTPPAQIPACGFLAPGSSVRLASALLLTPDSAIPFREVGLCTPALHVRHKFPLKALSPRHPLPPGSRSLPPSEYYEVIRLPPGLQHASFRLSVASLWGCCPWRVGSGLRPGPGFPLRGSRSVCRAPRPSLPRNLPASQVPDASLHASHALRGTPADPRDAHPSASSGWASGALTPAPSA